MASLTSVKFHANRHPDAASGTVYCYVYAVDGSGKPLGAAVGVSSINVTTLPIAPSACETITFTFSGVTLSDGQQYAFSAQYAGGGLWDFIKLDGSVRSSILSYRATPAGAWTTNNTVQTAPWLEVTTDSEVITSGGTGSSTYPGDTQIEYAVSLTLGGGGGLPSKPTNPSPATGVGDQRLNLVDLSWSNGGGATSYNVYAQTDAGGTLSQIASLHPNEYITLPWQFRPNYEQTYSWRVDAVNASGVTTGDVWTWDTMSYSPLKFNPAGGGYADIGGGGGASGYMPGGAIVSPVTRLIVAADNKIWYEDV